LSAPNEALRRILNKNPVASSIQERNAQNSIIKNKLVIYTEDRTQYLWPG